MPATRTWMIGMIGGFAGDIASGQNHSQNTLTEETQWIISHHFTANYKQSLHQTSVAPVPARTKPHFRHGTWSLQLYQSGHVRATSNSRPSKSARLPAHNDQLGMGISTSEVCPHLQGIL